MVRDDVNLIRYFCVGKIITSQRKSFLIWLDIPSTSTAQISWYPSWYMIELIGKANEEKSIGRTCSWLISLTSTQFSVWGLMSQIEKPVPSRLLLSHVTTECACIPISLLLRHRLTVLLVEEKWGTENDVRPFFSLLLNLKVADWILSSDGAYVL